MAYDTVINKAQLEGAITASANAIREKTGDTALIQWLADEGFAEAIAAIEAGGGGGIYETTITPAEDPMGSNPNTYVQINHGLGKIPRAVIVFRPSITGAVQYELLVSGCSSIGRSEGFVAFAVYNNGTTCESEAVTTPDGRINYSATLNNNFYNSPVRYMTEEYVRICGALGSAVARMKGGTTYCVVVIA